jgi:hypothetical protein
MQSDTAASDEEIAGGAAQQSYPTQDQQMQDSDDVAHDAAKVGGSDHEESIGQGEPRRDTSARASAQESRQEGTVPADAAQAEPANAPETNASVRAENEPLRAEGDASLPRAEHRATDRRIRRVLAGILVVLTCLTLLLTTVTVWAEQTFLNSDARWTAVVGPMAQDPNVVNALSAYVADQVVAMLQVQQRTQSVLPLQGQFLSAPLADTVRRYTQERVANAMGTEQFQQAWISVNTAAHRQVVAALRGQTQTVTNANGVVTLNLLPVIAQGLQTVRQDVPGLLPPQVRLPTPSSTESAQQGIQALARALGIQLPPDFGQVPLLRSDQFATAQEIVRLLDLLSIILPVATLLLLVATLWLSLDRRRTLIQLGIGFAVTFALAKLAIPVLQQQVVAAVADPTTRAIIQPVLERALSYLVTSTTWLLILGVVLALVAFLAGKLNWSNWFQAGHARA